jgi:hypothetical protein
MAVDILEMLVEILKINQNYVAEYAAQGVLYQLFYLLFFPTIFIVIFVWILSHAIIGEHKGLRLLLAVGVYAFIVLQGLYNWFVMLSKFWLFGLMFLGFIYFISYRGGRGGGGGGGAHGKTLGGGKGMMERITNRLQYQLSGQEKEKIELLKDHLNRLRSMPPETHAYGEMYFDTERELAELGKVVRDTDITGIGTTKFGGGDYQKLYKEFLNLHKPKKVA